MSFSILPGDPASPVVLHVPHSSRHIPADVRDGIVLGDDELATELNAMTDAHTDLVAAAVAERLPLRPWSMINRCSRLVVDPERFPDPEAEEMTAVGMGAVYTHTSDRRELRRPSEVDREHLIGRFFTPYADALTELVDDRLAATGAAVIVDVHSYPPEALPYELHADRRRPRLCLGVDEVHTPDALITRAHELFEEVVVDEPFAGTYVPLRHWRTDARVVSVMLELRRDTYLTDGRPDPDAIADLAVRVASLLG